MLKLIHQKNNKGELVYGLLNSDLTKRDEYNAQKSQQQYTENITHTKNPLKSQLSMV